VFVSRVDAMWFYCDLFINYYYSLSTMSYLYRHIIQNEEIRGLLPTDQTCTKIKNQTICGGEWKKVLKNS